MTTDTQAFNPFPGLRPFREDEDYLFFGREDQTIELLSRLGSQRFVAVVGTSASGKSSLVRCGLLSQLQGGKMLQAGTRWEIAITHPGGDPMRLLAESMLQIDLYDREEEEATERLLATLNRSHYGLVEAVRQADLEPGTNFLLVVDQFEEIFRFQSAGIDQREAASEFIAMLLQTAAQKDVPIYIVLTMRSDFIGDCAQFEGLAEAVNAGEFLIPRLTREQFKQVIEGPIKVAGGSITPRLLQRLLNDLGEQADQLPCLQHALMRTWEHHKKSEIPNPKSEVQSNPLTLTLSPSEGARENTSAASDHSSSAASGHALDLDDYHAIGRMGEALSIHADEIFQSLATDRQRALAALMFKALTVRESEKRGMRRPQRLGRLAEIVGVPLAELLPIVEAYRAHGVTFLMPPLEVDLHESTIIDISHESLMRVWVRLRDWVEEEAQSVSIFHRLADSAALQEKGKAGLYRDPELGIALVWRAETKLGAAWAEQYGGGFDQAMAYLDRSRGAAEREQKELEAARQRELERARQFAETQAKVARLFKRFAGSLAVGLCVAVGLTIWAFKLRQEAKRQETIAQAKKAEAEAQRAIAQRTAYNASMSSIQADWEKRNYRRVRETLATQKDYAEPSFEWLYWQRMTHLELSSFPTHAKGIRTFSVSRDGKKIVMVMKDDSIEVRSLPAGEKLATFLGNHKEYVSNAAFSPDGRLVASCGGQFFRGDIKLWNAETGEEIRSFGHFTDLDDPADAALPNQGVGGRQYGIAFSSDGRFLVTGGHENKVQLWEVSTGKKLRSFEQGNGGGWITHLALFTDGRRIVCQAGDTLRLYESDTGEIIDSLPGQNVLGGVGFALSPDSRRLAVHRGKIAIYDLTAKGFSKVLVSISENLPGGGLHLSFSPDGKRLVGSGGGDSAIYDSFTGAYQLTLRGGSWASEFLADSQRVISTDGDRHVKIWDADNNRERTKLTTGYIPCAIAKDGSRLLVHIPLEGEDRTNITRVGSTGGLGVMDTTTGKLLTQMREHEPELVDGGAFSPDGKWVASGGRDAGGTFRVWDAATGKVRLTIRTPGDEHYSIGFGPKGDTIISRIVRPIVGHAIWDIKTGKEIFSPRTPIDQHNWAMTRDGHRLATGDHRDGRVRIWDADTGKELLSLTDPAFEGMYLMYVTVAPDGGKVFAAPGEKKEVVIWEGATPEQVAAWRKEEEADAALWATEEPKVEERKLARIEAAAAKEKAAEEKRQRQMDAQLAAFGPAPKHQPSTQARPLVPGDPGAIRQWLVLAPLPLQSDVELVSVLKQQIPDEALLRPRGGEHSLGVPGGLAWTPVRLGEKSYQLNFLDLVEKAGRRTENQVAYAVTYVASESPQSNLTMLVGSDDGARIYLNEKEIYRRLEESLGVPTRTKSPALH